MTLCTASHRLSSHGILSAKNSMNIMKPLAASTAGCRSRCRPAGSAIQSAAPMAPTRNTTAYKRTPLAQPSAAASASSCGMSMRAAA